MRSYGDVVEVRRGQVFGSGPDLAEAPEVPAQFLWRGRLWKVREVIAHWIETGPWWEQSGVAALFGAEPVGSSDAAPSPVAVSDLLAEREHWRVEATRGRLPDTSGVFDLAFDWSDGCWRLVRCVD